jgi:hypothetical protein
MIRTTYSTRYFVAMGFFFFFDFFILHTAALRPWHICTTRSPSPGHDQLKRLPHLPPRLPLEINTNRENKDMNRASTPRTRLETVPRPRPHRAPRFFLRAILVLLVTPTRLPSSRVVLSKPASQTKPRCRQKRQNFCCTFRVPKQLRHRGVSERPFSPRCAPDLPPHDDFLVHPLITMLEEVLPSL